MMRRLRGPTPNVVRDIDGELLIGRTQADVEIGDDEVSRRHALIRPVPAGVEVEDLGSSNGTYVDGRRINGTVTLTENATLRVGQTELTVEVELPQATRISPPRIPQPGDATVMRPVARPDVTVARPQPDLPPATPPPPAGPPPSAIPAPQQPEPAGARMSANRLPLAAGGLVVVAIVVVGLILVLGGSSKKKTTPTTVAKSTTAATSTTTSAPSGGGGGLSLSANAGGALKFSASTLSAKAGKVTIQYTNQSPLAHNLTIQTGTGGAIVGATPTFQGGTKTLSVNLKPGTYTFFCSIPGHRQAGMVGTLTVS